MKVYPTNYTERAELNLRQGIKSSLSEIKELFALTFAMYLASNKEAVLNYSTELNQSTVSIEIEPQLYTALESFFGTLITNNADFKLKVNENPLFKSQIESLQVSLELFWKLSKVLFVNNSSDNNTRERTGGNRYAKQINYSTNIIIIDNALSENDGTISQNLKEILYNWIISSRTFIPNQVLYDKIQTLLTVFSEETQFKIRTNNNSEIYFQQEGIYNEIAKNNTIEDKDNTEPVGPFRILKSFIKSDLHKYIREDGNNGFNIKANASVPAIVKYNSMVNTSLNLIPRRTVVYEEISLPVTESLASSKPLLEHQVIFYGSPGTGKSREVENRTKGHNRTRTTFHPETDYHSFVGSYKPVMDGKEIKYEFIPQAFTYSYCNAWLNPDKPYFLIIEEINRGNCSQIFGDIFQCLDRDANGQSKYDVHCDKDLSVYLKETFTKATNQDAVEKYKAAIKSNDFDKIMLPVNLFIYATMNTSDQSLFPMDSAFKRRWDWEFTPVDYEDAKTLSIIIDETTSYNWGNFISKINPKIKELTGSEDKQIGNRFISPSDKKITFEQFRSKVLFYLWSEVYKDEVGSQNSIFKFLGDAGEIKDFQFGELFNAATFSKTPQELIIAFMSFNGIEKD